MNYKEFIQKYEELLNSGYCECNELNCLDNNPPKKILNIMKEQQQEIERLNNIINELEEELERESNMKEEDTCLEHNTFIDIKNTLKTVLKRLQELKGSDSNE